MKVGIDVYTIPKLENCLYVFVFCSFLFFLIFIAFSGSALKFLEFINHFIFHCKGFSLSLLLKIQRKLK